MAHIGASVRARREKLGWTIQKLATLSGLDSGFISRLERELAGYSAGTEERLARTLNTTVGTFHAAASNAVEIATDHRRIPILNYVQAGNFTYVNAEYLDNGMQETVMTSLEHSPHTFGMRLKGNSMEKEFREGDIVIIDPAIEPLPGDYVVAANDGGEAMFKKYRIVKLNEAGQQVFELVPLNPDYPAWNSAEHVLRVVGVMVEHRKPRRR